MALTQLDGYSRKPGIREKKKQKYIMSLTLTLTNKCYFPLAE